MDEPFAFKAILDDDLWNNISHHRQVFTSMRDVDYTSDLRRCIVLIPPEAIRDEWRHDYDTMRSVMIFGESLPFELLIERLEELQLRFHNISQ